MCQSSDPEDQCVFVLESCLEHVENLHPIHVDLKLLVHYRNRWQMEDVHLLPHYSGGMRCVYRLTEWSHRHKISHGWVWPYICHTGYGMVVNIMKESLHPSTFSTCSHISRLSVIFLLIATVTRGWNETVSHWERLSFFPVSKGPLQRKPYYTYTYLYRLQYSNLGLN